MTRTLPRAIRFVLLGILVPAGHGPGDQAASAPKPASDQAAAQRLAAPIRTIRTAKHGPDVVDAYRNARRIAPNSAALHEAFIRRMLKFGTVALAVGPARRLVKLDAYSGLAWGVLGYYDAAHTKRYAEALTSTVLAVKYAPKNPSILHNAGQLVAWYDGRGVATPLSEATGRILKEIRPRAAERPQFATSYAAVRKALTDGSERRDQISVKLGPLRAALAEATEEYRTLRGDLRDIQAKITKRKNHISDLWEQIWRSYHHRRAATRPARHGSAAEARFREALLEKINEEQDEIDDLEDHGKQIVDQLKALQAKARRWKASVGELETELAAIECKAADVLGWRLPAIDGVVVAETSRLPMALKARPPRRPSELAANELKLARLYLSNRLPARAKDILRKLISDYPATPAAKEAATLLAGLETPGR